MELPALNALNKMALATIRDRMEKAAGISQAAHACAAAGSSDKGVEVAMDLEQLLYETTTLLNAASLINRIAREG